MSYKPQGYYAVTFEINGGILFNDEAATSITNRLMDSLDHMNAQDIRRTFIWDQAGTPPDYDGDGHWEVSGLIDADNYLEALRIVAVCYDKQWDSLDQHGHTEVFGIDIISSEP